MNIEHCKLWKLRDLQFPAGPFITYQFKRKYCNNFVKIVRCTTLYYCNVFFFFKILYNNYKSLGYVISLSFPSPLLVTWPHPAPLTSALSIGAVYSSETVVSIPTDHYWTFHHHENLLDVFITVGKIPVDRCGRLLELAGT
jgi:hypothetical protein